MQGLLSPDAHMENPFLHLCHWCACVGQCVCLCMSAHLWVCEYFVFFYSCASPVWVLLMSLSVHGVVFEVCTDI